MGRFVPVDGNRLCLISNRRSCFFGFGCELLGFGGDSKTVAMGQRRARHCVMCDQNWLRSGAIGWLRARRGPKGFTKSLYCGKLLLVKN